jgi:hypothetical protein
MDQWKCRMPDIPEDSVGYKDSGKAKCMRMHACRFPHHHTQSASEEMGYSKSSKAKKFPPCVPILAEQSEKFKREGVGWRLAAATSGVSDYG